jgi:hypothetical protein
MSDLLSKIYAAQRDAAERAVIEHLESTIWKEPNVEALRPKAKFMNPISRDLRHCPPGQWKVVRVNGVIEVHLSKPTMAAVQDVLDTSRLEKIGFLNTSTGEHLGILMLADYLGFNERLPFNKLASEAYRAQVDDKYASIYGDVAIVNDADFK